ncbi:MAG: hypothetical protein KZQ84_20310, partial [Candidatus Thiodiazotropha sp. (ex Lucinoma borealis)]|nr:hypothetical protein [Candidatus Thiodiazotropha sp. (ex Lucinoma borealis)]
SGVDVDEKKLWSVMYEYDGTPFSPNQAGVSALDRGASGHQQRDAEFILCPNGSQHIPENGLA